MQTLRPFAFEFVSAFGNYSDYHWWKVWYEDDYLGRAQTVDPERTYAFDVLLCINGEHRLVGVANTLPKAATLLFRMFYADHADRYENGAEVDPAPDASQEGIGNP
jgi:hypothetical protein